jgi:hypothetical protein
MRRTSKFASILKYKRFMFVLSQTIVSLIKFIKKNNHLQYEMSISKYGVV